MIPKPSHPLKYLAPAAIVVAIVMSILPLTHSLFSRSQYKEKELSSSQITINEIPLEKKKPPQPQKPHLRRNLQRSSGPSTSRKEQLAFTPDLSIGTGGGLPIENPELSAVIFEENEADTPPKRLIHQPILYPERAREKGIEGVVELLIVIGRDGSVENIEFTSLPHPLFRNPIAEQVKGWRFTPGYHKGVPVRVRVRQSFDFSLE